MNSNKELEAFKEKYKKACKERDTSKQHVYLMIIKHLEGKEQQTYKTWWFSPL